MVKRTMMSELCRGLYYKVNILVRGHHFEHKLTFSSNMIKSEGPRALGVDSWYRKTWVETPISLLYLSYKQSYGQKRDFRETMVAILKMAVSR